MCQRERLDHPPQPDLAKLLFCPPMQVCFSLSSSGSWARYILVSRQQFFFPIAYFLPTRPGCPLPLSFHHHISELSQHCLTQTSPWGEPSSSGDYPVTAQVAVWLLSHTWERLWVLVPKGSTTICRVFTPTCGRCRCGVLWKPCHKSPKFR